jgi:dipeptidyl aminopeptidase/acylaminoacyl peptidase
MRNAQIGSSSTFGSQVFLVAAALLLSAVLPLGAQTNLFIVELRDENGRIVAGEPVKITERGGSQPSFTPDGRAILFSATRDGPGSRSDVYRYDIDSRAETRVTTTPENENSPTMGGDGRLIAVRWVPETLFVEYGPWYYSPDGQPLASVLPRPDTVGYYARIDDHRLALMRPASRFAVALHDTRSGVTEAVDSPVAPLPPQPIPGQLAVSYTVTDPAGANRIRKVDVETRQVTTLGPTLPGRTVHAWTPQGIILMGRGATLYAMEPARDTTWQAVKTFSNPELQQITSYVVSPRGDRLVLVSPTRPPLATEVQDSIRSAGVATAVAHVRALSSAGRLTEYDVSEGALIGIARDAQQRGAPSDAVQLAELIVELLPRSFRARAAAGEANQAAGDRSAAAAHYRAALELNSRSTPAEVQEYERVQALLQAMGRQAAHQPAAVAPV